MTVIASKSTSTSATSRMEKLSRDKYVLLAKVGHRKREALAYQEAEEFYSSIVTELLALSVAQTELLQDIADRADSPSLRRAVAADTSRLHRLTKRLLSFWPKNSDSQKRVSDLLESAGVAKLLTDTEDGYVTLSTGQILANVARAIGLTKEQYLRT